VLVVSLLIAQYKEIVLGKREKERTVKSKYSPVPLPGTFTGLIFVAIGIKELYNIYCIV
jgi:hypothetical protein